MNAERFQKVEALFQDALDRPPSERAKFIDDACVGDEELKNETTSLVDAYLEADDFIEEPALVQDARVLLDVTNYKIGREIGPYHIIEQLGAGGMGEVYLAEDKRLSRRVALKLLPSYFASDDTRVRRFQSEARAASALNHPNILTIYEVGENESGYFIATEFVDGQTIRDLLQQRELSLEEILDYVTQIASALSAAHAAGIVHRDIKPENIMLRPDGLLKILDFGIAKLLEPADTLPEPHSHRTLTETGLVLGTVSYMSPEQARGLPVDERTDIWSLGIVFYEMLARRLPFNGATRMDTMVAILDRDPAPLPVAANQHYASAPLLQSVIDKCLGKDVTQRYRKVSDLSEDLKRVREQLNNGPRPRKSRLAVAVFAILLMIIVATAGLLFYRRQAITTNVSQGPIQPAKLYSEMSEAERMEFVSSQEHRVSTLMSKRAVKLNDDSVRVIKAYVDRYAANLNQPSQSGSERLEDVYQRAQPYIPVIGRAFAARKVPPVIGIYLPVIESSYQSCYVSPSGARGLFQFMPPTAQNYGVARADMCDVEKMAPAAAHFFADRMAELGEDSGSVTLVLLSYNRGAEGVRESLRQLRGTENYERNFWTLLAKSGTPEEILNDENAGYVPSFFAAAIIGENPRVFGLKTPPLSTLAGANTQR